MGRPPQATRVSAWVRCFLQLNRRWLIQLTKEARTALRTLLPVRCLVGGVHARCVECRKKGQTFGQALIDSHHPSTHPTIRDYVSLVYLLLTVLICLANLCLVGQAMSDSSAQSSTLWK